MRDKTMEVSLICLFLMLGFAIMTLPTPHLIGHNCEGTGGDIWAMEESDFPRCEMIERNL